MRDAGMRGAPVGASIDPVSGVFSWTPSEVQGPGSYTFDVVVTETDGSPTNLSDSESITVTLPQLHKGQTGRSKIVARLRIFDAWTEREHAWKPN